MHTLSVVCPVKKCLDLRHDLQPCFFHVDHHPLHHDRFRTSAVHTRSSLEIQFVFRLISYRQRLFLDTLGRAILACASGPKARSSGGERYLDTVEVDGSRPSAPTTQLRASACLS
jgi:hypothetical protein